MGVYRSDWIVIGANIGMENYDDDSCDKYDELCNRDKFGELTYLIDEMRGEYFIVGVVVKAADEYSGFGLTEITTLDSFEKDSEIVRKHVKENFGLEVTPKLIVLTHFD